MTRVTWGHISQMVLANTLEFVTQARIVENFRPGIMTRLGFDPEEMVKKYPKLIFASISGFGQYGPWSKQAAYDTIVQALSGLMDFTGTPDGKPTRVSLSKCYSNIK